MNHALNDFIDAIEMIPDYCETAEERRTEILRELRNFLMSSGMQSEDIVREVKKHFAEKKK